MLARLNQSKQRCYNIKMSFEECEPKSDRVASFELTELESRVLQRYLPLRYAVVEVASQKGGNGKVSQKKTPKKEPKSAKIIEEHQPLRESRPRRAPAKKYDRYLEEEPERPTKPKEVNPDPRDSDSHSDPHIEASQEKPESPEQPSQKAEDPQAESAR